jgi:hypothetical protein
MKREPSRFFHNILSCWHTCKFLLCYLHQPSVLLSCHCKSQTNERTTEKATLGCTYFIQSSSSLSLLPNNGGGLRFTSCNKTNKAHSFNAPLTQQLPKFYTVRQKTIYSTSRQDQNAFIQVYICLCDCHRRQRRRECRGRVHCKVGPAGDVNGELPPKIRKLLYFYCSPFSTIVDFRLQTPNSDNCLLQVY